MTSNIERDRLVKKLIVAAENDARIVGLVSYGSISEGHADVWSDIDVAVFIRDADFETFEAGWHDWAAQFGTLLLGYISGVGHPWAVYEASPVPIRVDFVFYRESDAEAILTWTNSPNDIHEMVWYDGSAGKLTALAEQTVGRSLDVPDFASAFEQVSGDFWYYVLRTWSKLQRGQVWAFRFEYNFVILGNLMALLRLEAGATESWRKVASATGIESAISAERLAQLNRCIPGADDTSLMIALHSAISLGRDVCSHIATKHGLSWPHRLAENIEQLLHDSHSNSGY